MFFCIILCLKVNFGMYACFFKDLITDKSYFYMPLFQTQFLCMYRFTWWLWRICLSSLFRRGFRLGLCAARRCIRLTWRVPDQHLYLWSGVEGVLEPLCWERCSLVRKWLANRLTIGQKLGCHDVSCVTITVSWYRRSRLRSSVALWAEAVQFSHFVANNFHGGYKSIMMPLSVTQRILF